MQSKIPYRELLDSEFAQRKMRNQGYSLRAFARDLKLAPSQLSEILSGKRGLNPAKANQVAKKLMLNEKELAQFELSVIAQHHRSPQKRSDAKAELSRHFKKRRLDLEKFKIISDWHHFAILEFVRIHPTKNQPELIGGQLNISAEACREAIQRLLLVGLLKIEEGFLKDQGADIFVGEEIPSSAIRNHHRQIMGHADRAIDTIPMDQRELQSLIFSIPQESIGEFKKMVQKFASKINSTAEAKTSRDRVYALGIQLIPLSKEIKTGGKS